MTLVLGLLAESLFSAYAGWGLAGMALAFTIRIAIADKPRKDKP